MKHEDIPLPPAVRRIADLLLETVARGLNWCVRRFGEPARAWRSNAGATTDLGYALVRLRRLHRILRYVFIILAARFTDPKPARPAHPIRPAMPDDPATWRMSFTTSTPYHAFCDDGAHPRPQQFTRVARDPLRTLARKMEGLRRALANPMRHVRRLARVLRERTVVFRWRPPKRQPPMARRDDYEELLMGFEQARWDVRRLNSS